MYHVTLQLHAKLMPLDRGEYYEDPIAVLLEEKGIGTVTGGGTLLQENGEVSCCDIEIELNSKEDAIIQQVLTMIETVKVPKGSLLLCDQQKIAVGSLEGLALYLNGTQLSDEVYASCDVNEVVRCLEEAIKGLGFCYSHFQGNEETALYFYGTSFEEMQQRMLPFITAYPLCERSRIVCVSSDDDIQDTCIAKENMQSSEGEPTPLLQQMAVFLDCPYQYVAPMEDDDPLMEAFDQAIERGKEEGFIPMIICEDETLWECLLMNADPHSEQSAEAYTKEAVCEYRQTWLQEPVLDGAQVFGEWMEVRKEDAASDELDWDKDIIGELDLEEAEEQTQYLSYWNYDTKETIPLIIAEIPVKHPWEIFAWLPFGGWNDCPDTQDLIAAAHYWYQKYQAIPAVMTHDTLEYRLPAAIKEEDALQLATEHYAYCPDVEDENGGIASLAANLTVSKLWYFWWD